MMPTDDQITPYPEEVDEDSLRELCAKSSHSSQELLRIAAARGTWSSADSSKNKELGRLRGEALWRAGQAGIEAIQQSLRAGRDIHPLEDLMRAHGPELARLIPDLLSWRLWDEIGVTSTGEVFRLMGPAALPFLDDALQDANGRVRFRAVTGLGILKAVSNDAATMLFRALRDRTLFSLAVEALVWTPHQGQAPEAMTAVYQRMAQSNAPLVRYGAIAAMLESGMPLTGRMRRTMRYVLRREADEIRLTVARCLGARPEPSTREILRMIEPSFIDNKNPIGRAVLRGLIWACREGANAARLPGPLLDRICQIYLLSNPWLKRYRDEEPEDEEKAERFDLGWLLRQAGAVGLNRLVATYEQMCDRYAKAKDPDEDDELRHFDRLGPGIARFLYANGASSLPIAKRLLGVNMPPGHCCNLFSFLKDHGATDLALNMLRSHHNDRVRLFALSVFQRTWPTYDFANTGIVIEAINNSSEVVRQEAALWILKTTFEVGVSASEKRFLLRGLVDGLSRHSRLDTAVRYIEVEESWDMERLPKEMAHSLAILDPDQPHEARVVCHLLEGLTWQQGGDALLQILERLQEDVCQTPDELKSVVRHSRHAFSLAKVLAWSEDETQAHLANGRLLVLLLDRKDDPLVPRLAEISWFKELRHFEVQAGNGDDVVRELVKNPHVNGLRSLDFHATRLTDQGARHLAETNAFPHLESLNIQDIDGRLSPEGARSLANSPQLGGLRHLYLIDHPIGDDGARAIAESPCLRSLESLELSGAGIGPTGVIALASSPNLASMRTIHLIGCEITLDAAHKLAASPYLGNLKRLLLRWGSITPPLLRVLAQAPWWSNLAELILDYNELGDEGAVVLAETIRGDGLKVLSLEKCGLGAAGAVTLARAPGLRGLRTLRLQDNKIGDAGLTALIEASMLGKVVNRWITLNEEPRLQQWLVLDDMDLGISAMQSLANSPDLALVTDLKLDKNALGDDGVAALAASPHFGNLTSLFLVDVRMGDEGAARLADAPGLDRLKKLWLSNNRIGDAGAIALARSPHLASLHEIFLDGNQIGHEGGMELCHPGRWLWMHFGALRLGGNPLSEQANAAWMARTPRLAAPKPNT